MLERLIQFNFTSFEDGDREETSITSQATFFALKMLIAFINYVNKSSTKENFKGGFILNLSVQHGRAKIQRNKRFLTKI